MKTAGGSLVRNLFRVALSSGVASGAAYLVTLLCSRLLGPAAFGQYSVALSIAAILIIPMQAGLGMSLLKFLPDAVDPRRVLSTAGMATLATTVLTAGVTYMFRDVLAAAAGAHESIWIAAILLAIALTCYSVIDAGLRGTLRFSSFAWMQVIVPLVTGIFVMIGLFGVGSRSFLVPVLGAAGGYAVGALLFAPLLPWRAVFSWSSLRGLVRYGAWGLVAAIAGVVLGNADRLMINAGLGAVAIGTYAVYTLGINLLLNKVTQIIVSVLFPTAARRSSRREVFAQLLRFCRIATPLALIVFPCVGLATVLIAGPQYELDVGLLLLLGINASIYLPMNLFAWFVAALSASSNRYTALVHIVAALTNLGANVVLLPVLGMKGAAIAALVSTVISAVLIAIKMRAWLGEEIVVT